MDRKNFFKMAFKLGMQKGMNVLSENPIVKALEKLSEDVKQRPPGAKVNDDAFKKLCTGCDACMIACPVNVIMIDDLEKRFPVIYPERDPCIMCEGYPCIASCPTGALTLENVKDVTL